MAGSTPPINGMTTRASQELPLEPGTIELRADGSVTVTGHRVRLRQIVEAIESGQGGDAASIADEFPTIDPVLLERVVRYIARFPEAIARYMSEERDMERHYSSLGTHVSMEELRRLFKQAR